MRAITVLHLRCVIKKRNWSWPLENYCLGTTRAQVTNRWGVPVGAIERVILDSKSKDLSHAI